MYFLILSVQPSLGMSKKSKEQVCLEIFVSSTISACFKVPSFNTGNCTVTIINKQLLIKVLFSVLINMFMNVEL